MSYSVIKTPTSGLENALKNGVDEVPAGQHDIPTAWIYGIIYLKSDFSMSAQPEKTSSVI